MFKKLRRQYRSTLIHWLRPGKTTQELQHVLQHAEAIQSDEQRRMFEDIVEFRETRVREIMVPRSDIYSIDLHAGIEQAEAKMLEYHVKKLLVSDGDLDHIAGFIDIRDVLHAHRSNELIDLASLIRPCLKVSELEHIPGLLNKMKTGSHIAVVRDEFGGTAGLVTLSDLLEEIVGDIGQGQSTDDSECVQTDSGWEVLAKMHVEDLADVLRIELPEGDYDTVGGLITTDLGRIPVRGERLLVAGLDIHIKEADPRRVIRVLIRSASVEPTDNA
ncbi:MAG: ion transporter [Zetaproteobacteria bacterium CG_4_9_14_3_um_filter_49_83]|nr:MAG: hypothetical protein AUJ56_10865 [Zetaproteobacteria bacterium CG1_02_49_23]PIQ29963.1 MAG: ion transporter [Zetaproteobacteria bacterium CG17_big_fil_post_rev_8_21_14_2_50_50_13]PIV31460.1 MAG: ion transporter [Zetaproteobacteria bacterium CG02_land_8_20_14_3_00_50_9]PIY55018.1 MAG: ion transporter [Zetaproteobacteria bacterium CG_4_10_14_0_8_um_filter_49_80]PJA36530.1 MAG: ion transporter [Zetaproteobacteria bacterium CG_4_9_14_3_um_filter_49_83]